MINYEILYLPYYIKYYIKNNALIFQRPRPKPFQTFSLITNARLRAFAHLNGQRLYLARRVGVRRSPDDPDNPHQYDNICSPPSTIHAGD